MCRVSSLLILMHKKSFSGWSCALWLRSCSICLPHFLHFGVVVSSREEINGVQSFISGIWVSSFTPPTIKPGLWRNYRLLTGVARPFRICARRIIQKDLLQPLVIYILVQVSIFAFPHFIESSAFVDCLCRAVTGFITQVSIVNFVLVIASINLLGSVLFFTFNSKFEHPRILTFLLLFALVLSSLAFILYPALVICSSWLWNY